jgi:hypothetical protein
MPALMGAGLERLGALAGSSLLGNRPCPLPPGRLPLQIDLAGLDVSVHDEPPEHMELRLAAFSHWGKEIRAKARKLGSAALLAALRLSTLRQPFSDTLPHGDGGSCREAAFQRGASSPSRLDSSPTHLLALLHPYPPRPRVHSLSLALLNRHLPRHGARPCPQPRRIELPSVCAARPRQWNAGAIG